MFKKYYESCQEESDKLTHASDKVSLLRGIIFATAGLLLFIGYQQKNPVLLILAFGLFLTFITLVLYHNKLEKEQEYLKDSQSVLKDYMARFEDGWKSFPVDGTRYLNEEFLEARDLDLLGKSSLYQYICTASTIWGQDQLALWLSMSGKVFSMDSALQLSQEIKSRQEAVAELSQKMELCMELEIGARRLRNIKYEKSKKIMDDFFHTLETRIHFPVVCRILFRLFPLLTLFFLFCALLGIYRHLAMPLFSFLAFAQLLSAFLGNHWNNKALSPIYQMNKTITPYRNLFQLL